MSDTPTTRTPVDIPKQEFPALAFLVAVLARSEDRKLFFSAEEIRALPESGLSVAAEDTGDGIELTLRDETEPEE